MDPSKASTLPPLVVLRPPLPVRLMTRLSGHFRRSAEPLNDVRSVEEVANTGAGAVAAAPARWAKAALLFMGRVTLTGLPAT
mmetsp:Transcript_58520/g.164079  ORF Transcript_58520/g.164079 Transcript_58520/m.164079 type:complete len:82 (+) Transcript_58520:282-527(+)